MAGGFECTFVELDLIGAVLDADVRQFPLQIPVPPDRTELVPSAEKSLAAKGLVRGTTFTPGLRRTIEIFTRGRVAVAMMATSRDRSHRVRAVLGGRVAVVARQRGDAVRFTPVRPESMVRQVLSQLPPMRPGPGSSTTVTAPSDDFSYLEPVHQSASAADQILRRPRLGSGYVTVTAARKPVPATVSWLDTDAGRYAAIPDSRGDVTYTPADLHKLEQIVTRLVSRLT